MSQEEIDQAFTAIVEQLTSNSHEDRENAHYAVKDNA